MNKFIVETPYLVTGPTGIARYNLDLALKYDKGLFEGYDNFFGEPMIVHAFSIVETPNSITIITPPTFVPIPGTLFIVACGLLALVRRFRKA